MGRGCEEGRRRRTAGRRTLRGATPGRAWLPLLALLAAACDAGDGPSPQAGQAVLNEVDCHGRDWIEIVNTSGADLAVGGWAVADDLQKEGHRYLLPAGTLMRAGERLLVRQQKDLEAGFAFGIGCDKDTVYLLDAGEAVVDRVVLGAVPDGSTWGRLPDLSGPWQETSPTGGSPNQPPPSAAAVLFDPAVVNAVALDLPAESVAALTAAPYEWTRGTVTVTVGGAATGPVAAGVRLKSGASFRPLGQKASFKLDFDRFDEQSRLLGLKSLVLNGMVHDPTGLHETLAYAVFRAAGVPAARTGYARLTVNGRDQGLYLVLEAYDDIFTDARFDSSAHVYEGQKDILPGTLRDAIDVDEGDPDDLSDLEALAATVHDTGDAGWIDAVSLRLDLDAFLRHWAAENWVGQLDGYSQLANNYFLHADDNGRFTMMPWGLDWAFVQALPAPACEKSVLCVRCLGIPACRARFDDALQAVHGAARGLGLPARAAALEATVGPQLESDPLWEFDAAARAAGMATLRSFLDLRATSPGGAFPAP